MSKGRTISGDPDELPDNQTGRVVQTWVDDLTLSMQGTLLCAVRGPDGAPKEDPAKALIRCFRACVLNSALANTPTGFSGDGSLCPTEGQVTWFFQSIDQYNLHWFGHFVNAVKIIAYMHPNDIVRVAWGELHTRFVEALHMSPETKAQMTKRLRFDGPGVEIDLSKLVRPKQEDNPLSLLGKLKKQFLGGNPEAKAIERNSVGNSLAQRALDAGVTRRAAIESLAERAGIETRSVGERLREVERQEQRARDEGVS